MARTSPLSLLLCAFFFLTASVSALSAVLGVDLGTEYIKAALVKPGIPLEIVLTKDSRRKETSAVAFKPPQNGAKPGSYPERAYGSDAMALFPRFPADVYPNLKDDPRPPRRQPHRPGIRCAPPGPPARSAPATPHRCPQEQGRIYT